MANELYIPDFLPPVPYATSWPNVIAISKADNEPGESFDYGKYTQIDFPSNFLYGQGLYGSGVYAPLKT